MQFHNIVFPVDFSERSRAAAPFIHSMARRNNAAVHLIHAVPPLPALYFDVGSACSEAFDPAPVIAGLRTRLVEFGAENFPYMDVSCEVVNGEAVPNILDCALRNHADLIALPTHGYGTFRRALLGSVTSKILHDAHIPVWTSAHCTEASHRAHPQPRTIIAAVEREDESDPVFRTAMAIAREVGAVVESVCLASKPAYAGVGFGSVMVEEEAPRAIEIAVREAALSKRADLVVVGREKRFHAYAVICDAPCPVLSI